MDILEDGLRSEFLFLNSELFSKNTETKKIKKEKKEKDNLKCSPHRSPFWKEASRGQAVSLREITA